MPKYDLSEEHLKIIEQLLDMALKQGGLANKPAVDKMLQVFSKPIIESNKKTNEKSNI